MTKQITFSAEALLKEAPKTFSHRNATVIKLWSYDLIYNIIRVT